MRSLRISSLELVRDPALRSLTLLLACVLLWGLTSVAIIYGGSLGS